MARHFVSDSKAEFDEESKHIPLFMAWFLHRWSPDPAHSRVGDRTRHGVSPTAEYLRRKRSLDRLLREYLESCLAAPFSVFEVVDADPGSGLLLKDLLAGVEHDVAERSASAMLQQGDVVFGQLASAGGVTLLEASQPFVIPPIWKIDVVEFRSRHFDGATTVPAERVHKVEAALIALYRDIANRLFDRRLPTLQNSDGEPLSPRRVVFDVPSAQEAFDALKYLALDESDDDLLRDAAWDGNGALQRVRVPWLKRGNAKNPGWPNTVLGSIEIEGTRLVADVNSERREAALRDIVAGALGDRARYRATEITSLEKLLAEDRDPARASTENSALPRAPEVQAKIREIMTQHYEQWITDKIPALGGRTPLAAVNDPAGSEAVDALVRQIERDGARMRPALDPAIICCGSAYGWCKCPYMSEDVAMPVSRLGNQVAEVAAALNAIGARFALIGGLAMASHGSRHAGCRSTHRGRTRR